MGKNMWFYKLKKFWLEENHWEYGHWKFKLPVFEKKQKRQTFMFIEL